jgi:hypothetical protein
MQFAVVDSISSLREDMFENLTESCVVCFSQNDSHHHPPPQQSWLRIDAHNDGALALHAHCTLQLLKDDGTDDGAIVPLPPATIAAGSRALIANLTSSCPPGARALSLCVCFSVFCFVLRKEQENGCVSFLTKERRFPCNY